MPRRVPYIPYSLETQTVISTSQRELIFKTLYFFNHLLHYALLIFYSINRPFVVFKFTSLVHRSEFYSTVTTSSSTTHTRNQRGHTTRSSTFIHTQNSTPHLDPSQAISSTKASVRCKYKYVVSYKLHCTTNINTITCPLCITSTVSTATIVLTGRSCPCFKVLYSCFVQHDRYFAGTFCAIVSKPS